MTTEEQVEIAAGPVGRRRRRSRGADVAVATAVLAVVLGTVILEGRRGPPAPPPPALVVAQQAADALAARHGCPAGSNSSASPASGVTPTPVLLPSTLYAAKVVTTAGNFTVLLYTGSVSTATNDFVFLAGRKVFDCAALTVVTPGGVVGVSGTVLRGAPRGAIPLEASIGTLVGVPGQEPGTGAAHWFIVSGARGTSVPVIDTVFGKVTQGLSVVQRISADASAGGSTPKVVYRILSITIVALQGAG